MVLLVRPPRSALAAEMADDVVARRMAAALDRGDDGSVVVGHSPVPDGISEGSRLDERIAGARIGRHGVADAAGVDHPDVADGAVQRPVGVADTHQLGRCSSDQRGQLRIRKRRVDTCAVILARCDMGRQDEGAIQ
jgi:hypothetical protein